MKTFLRRIFIVCILFFAATKSFSGKNTCTHFLDYFLLPISKNCYNNPELYLNTPQILDRRQIPYENHTVITKDGYILSITKMTRKNPKGVIVIAHCLTMDSAVWFLGYHQSVALTFYHAGYEIWLPNFRGTRFSDQHTDPDISSRQYWNFSFHEIGLYDFPAILNYIKSKTRGQKLIFMGHSLASTAALVYASQKPLEAEKNVEIFVTLCPTSFAKHAGTPGKYVALGLPIFEIFANKIGWVSVFKPFQLILPILKKIFLVLPLQIPAVLLCALAWGHIWRPFQMDPDNFPMLLGMAPQGTSWKNFYHYGQLLTSEKFQTYDYGKKENKKVYGFKKPLEYDLSAIKVPFYVVHGTEDTMVDPKDMNQLYAQLPAKVKIRGKMEIKGFNHGDFLYGRHRFTKVYQKIIQFLDNNTKVIN